MAVRNKDQLREPSFAGFQAYPGVVGGGVKGKSPISLSKNQYLYLPVFKPMPGIRGRQSCLLPLHLGYLAWNVLSPLDLVTF